MVNFIKGKMQSAKREGNPDGVVYGEGEGGHHMAASVNSSEGEASLLFCACLLVRRCLPM